MDAAKELLQYGLKGTDLEALVAIGKGADYGRLVLEIYAHRKVDGEQRSAEALGQGDIKPHC